MNDSIEEQLRMKRGRLFRMRGAATMKARSPHDRDDLGCTRRILLQIDDPGEKGYKSQAGHIYVWRSNSIIYNTVCEQHEFVLNPEVNWEPV